MTAGAAFRRDLVASLPVLRRCAMRLTRSADRADDLVQDTVAIALRFEHTFTPGSNMLAWCATIMRNTFLTQAKRASRIGEMPADFEEVLAAPEAITARLEVLDVCRLISQLPRNQAEAVLAVADGCTYDDFALRLGVPAGTVKSRISRGREALARRLEGV